MRAVRLKRIVRLGCVLFLCASCGSPEEPSAETYRPAPSTSILLITVDTLRADFLGCYGRETLSTPFIDELALRGVRFESAVAQVPLTTPSHASILTGTYPPVHQIRDMGGFRLASGVPTLAETLQKAGFDTAAVVAAAVLNREYELDRGFRVYDDRLEAAPSHPGLPGVVAEIRADRVTDRALQWLEAGWNGSSPFLLWVHYYDPHFPYDPPEPYRSRYAEDLYAGEIAYTDEQIGRLLQGLSRRGVQDQTLVVFLSDHGESLGEHGERTHGVFLYDSTMRIPLIFSGPGIPENRVIGQQVRSIDLFPTLLDYLGLAPEKPVAGVSLLPALREGRPVRSHQAYMETVYPKIHMGWSELRALRTDEWKLVLAPRPELYRLSQDPGERENLVTRYPAEADRLQKQIWEVVGPPERDARVEYRPVDEETRQRLQALGYVSAGASREVRLDSSGADPKDRVTVLQGIEEVTEWMNADRFEAAVPLLENLLAQDATNPLLYHQLGLCLQRTGQFERAGQVYREAIRQGADTDQTFAELGETFIRLGKLEEAVTALEEAARRNPANLDNLTNLASAYLQLGRLGEAEEQAQAILAQRPGHGAAHNVLGLVEIQRGNGDRARRHFEDAIRHQPGLAEPYMNLGILARRAGQRRAAARYFRLFLERATGPQYREILPRVRAALAELEGS